MLVCKYCTRTVKNKIGKSSHERVCKLNPNPGKPGMLGKKHSEETKKKISDYELTDEQRLRLSDANRRQEWSDDRRQRACIAMKKAVLRNPDSYTANNVCGRVKVGEYKGEKFYFSTGSVSNGQILPEGKFSFEKRPARANRLAMQYRLRRRRAVPFRQPAPVRPKVCLPAPTIPRVIGTIHKETRTNNPAATVVSIFPPHCGFNLYVMNSRAQMTRFRIVQTRLDGSERF